MSNPYRNLANSVLEDGSSTTGSDSEVLSIYPLLQSQVIQQLTKGSGKIVPNRGNETEDEDRNAIDDDPPHDLMISKQVYRSEEVKPLESGVADVLKNNKNMEESTLISKSTTTPPLVERLEEEETQKLSSSGDNQDSNGNSSQNSNNADLLSDDSESKSTQQLPEGNQNSPEQEDDKEEEEEEDEEDPIIKNEPIIKPKIPLSASIALTKVPLSTTTILNKLQKDPEPTQSFTNTESATTASSQTSTERITIRCIPIGSTPALHPTIFRISYTQPFSTLIKFITKKLQKLKKNEEVKSVFCYVNSSFAPVPDVSCGELFKAYGNRGELVVNYCEIVAFG